jgi:16S rRNA pseudouridine516 synthase
MTIHQGVYHQVKRMLAAVGNKVDRLHRAQMGALQLTELALGQWQYLSTEQVNGLRDSELLLQI